MRVCVHIRVRVLGECTGDGGGLAGPCSVSLRPPCGDMKAGGWTRVSSSLTCLVGDAGCRRVAGPGRWLDHLPVASWPLHTREAALWGCPGDSAP